MIFLVFLLALKPAAAFLSPSTLSIVAASLMSFIWGIVVIVGVNVLLFFRKAKKNLKKIVLIISICILATILVLSYGNYHKIKEINNEFDDVNLLKYEVDLNSISLRELHSYTILSVETDTNGPLYLKENYMNIDFDNLTKAITNFSDFETMFNLSKDKKYLVVCERGHSSSMAMEKMSMHGYNASFARLARTHNYEILAEFYESPKKRPSTGLIIVPYDDEKDTVVFDFRFIPRHQELVPKGTLSIDYEYFKPYILEGKNIVCLTNFHCVLTQYALDHAGIKDRKIYKIPIDEKEYMTTRQVDLILPENA